MELTLGRIPTGHYYNNMRKYQYYNTNDDDDRDGYTANWMAQTFTPVVDHVVGKVKLKLFRVGDPGTITVSIKATSGGKPVGADLCSGTILGTDITLDSNGDWYEISFGDGFDLDIGAQYAIVVRAPSGDASNKVSWRADITSPTFTGGTFVSSSDSGVDWSVVSGVDCMFEEWGVGPASPTTIVWGNLFKSQISAEKIEEAIARFIQNHEDDPDAHIETGESLQSHKASAIIDHIVDSIITDKIKDGEITNPKIIQGARAYTAIVDPSGDYDFTDIQDAIDAVETLGRGIIFVRPGTYSLSTPLVIQKNDVILLGQGSASIITLDNNVNDDVIQLEATSGLLERVSVLNLKIDGNGANQTDGRGIHGIKSGAGTGISNITIRNLEITAAKKDAIDFESTVDAKECLVENNYIHDNLSYGIFIGDGEDNLITNNIFKDNTSIQIYFNSGKHNMAINNRIEGGTTGIRMSNGETQDVISGNLIYNCSGDGILLQDNVSHTIVEGNFIDTAGGSGIQATGFTGVCRYNVISDNAILNSDDEGIEMYNNSDNAAQVSKNTISNNTIYKSGKNGIKLRGVQYNTIQGNTFDENGSDGNDTYADIFIRDNERGAPTYSLYNTISGNAINCTGANKSKYCIRENDANNNYNIVLGNITNNAVTTNISTQGANTIKEHNIE